MELPDVSLDRLRVFLTVMSTGGFTLAARRLRVGKSAVSQQIAKLEAELGHPLFTRTTRHVVPTEAAARLNDVCMPLLRDLETAIGSMGSSGLSGNLRVTAPSDYANIVLCRALAEFSSLHSQLRIELIADSKPLDLVEQGLDLGIRLGWPRDSTLRAIKVGDFGLTVVAAPSYLAKWGPPRHPGDLAGRDFIALSVLRQPLVWNFSNLVGETHRVRVLARFSVNTVECMLGFARCGLGISIATDFSVGSDLKQGSLVQVLSEWNLPRAGIYLTWPNTRVESPKVRTLINFLRGWFKQNGAAIDQRWLSIGGERG
ncbi:MAG: LysR family transcriptional regulator [Xanthomonadales bacterium]|nr:LysR family transcriptional regulator [Xanthomonadales bacterium]